MTLISILVTTHFFFPPFFFFSPSPYPRLASNPSGGGEEGRAAPAPGCPRASFVALNFFIKPGHPRPRPRGGGGVDEPACLVSPCWPPPGARAAWRCKQRCVRCTHRPPARPTPPRRRPPPSPPPPPQVREHLHANISVQRTFGPNVELATARRGRASRGDMHRPRRGVTPSGGHPRSPASLKRPLVDVPRPAPLNGRAFSPGRDCAHVQGQAPPRAGRRTPPWKGWGWRGGDSAGACFVSAGPPRLSASPRNSAGERRRGVGAGRRPRTLLERSLSPSPLLPTQQTAWPKCLLTPPPSPLPPSLPFHESRTIPPHWRG